jgi:hypothetical protein
VRFQAQTDLTQQVCEAVVEGLALLPRDLKQRFIDAGVTVVITPTMQQFHNKSGLPDYDPAIKTVVICERNAGGAGGTLRRGDIKTLHEFGHAFDQMVGYPSRDSKFRTVYSQEVAAVPMADRNLLSTFIQGDPVGPRECFASLFASLYYRGADSRLATLKADFPNCLRLVREMQR